MLFTNCCSLIDKNGDENGDAFLVVLFLGKIYFFLIGTCTPLVELTYLTMSNKIERGVSVAYMQDCFAEG